MNCCTGNCNQGRDCPARCADDDGEELSQLETVMLYLILAAALCVPLALAGLLAGYLWGVFA